MLAVVCAAWPCLWGVGYLRPEGPLVGQAVVLCWIGMLAIGRLDAVGLIQAQLLGDVQTHRQVK